MQRTPDQRCEVRLCRRRAQAEVLAARGPAVLVEWQVCSGHIPYGLEILRQCAVIAHGPFKFLVRWYMNDQEDLLAEGWLSLQRSE